MLNINNLFGFAKEQQKESIKKNYLSSIEELKEIKKEHKVYENIWSSIHLILGLCAIIFSLISAILTFYQGLPTYILFSINLLSTASAFSLTFLDPSSRSSKRKYMHDNSRRLIHAATIKIEEVDDMPPVKAIKEQKEFFKDRDNTLC